MCVAGTQKCVCCGSERERVFLCACAACFWVNQNEMREKWGRMVERIHGLGTFGQRL